MVADWKHIYVPAAQRIAGGERPMKVNKQTMWWSQIKLKRLLALTTSMSRRLTSWLAAKGSTVLNISR